METDPIQIVNLCPHGVLVQIYTVMRTDQIYELLEARRLELGLSQLQVGQLAFGRADSSAIQNLKRGSSPTFDRLQAIASALGLELYLGPKRVDGTGFSEVPPVATINAPSKGIYLPLPWHPMTRKPGATPVAFHGEWLETAKLDPERLALVDPVHIYLDRKDTRDLLLVVDVHSRRSAQPEPWAFIDHGQVAVGLVQFSKEVALLLPSTIGSAARVISGKDQDELVFLGRVVWQCYRQK
ncbi:hypothetical protein HYN69_04300 [Gemmobacter aquarius]|uniref:HTH cro/C1-type domain-containing protein n=1 Tax=Paragemmobacter aquarius TaxID=2169400 RepID=A0A2S0UJ71_9RHOB|nr:helix-turn-helix transcriptional regulator [Gemmobacter aquarius]AWB47835.1 hypothetical protein HYN69_04300 [Gemmobacter aquarius]